MHLALDLLPNPPGFLVIDGNRFTPYNKVPHACVIQGDGIYASIAAASILAKTYRDEYMIRLHEEYPYYKWNTNKGYGTRAHREAIDTHGMCPYHRRTFQYTSLSEIHYE
jgi:ribonuclease HII